MGRNSKRGTTKLKKYKVYLYQTVDLGHRIVNAVDKQDATNKAYVLFDKMDRDAEGVGIDVKEYDEDEEIYK